MYAAGSISLAALEVLVHLDSNLLPPDLIVIEIEVPDRLTIDAVPVERLPSNWRDHPAPDALQDIGTQWATGKRTAILSVPSAIVPQERNYLLNPAHHDFGRIAIASKERFHLDPRLRK